MHRVGTGITFTLYLPLKYAAAEPIEVSPARSLGIRDERHAVTLDVVADDRSALNAERPTLLVVEDDARYATVLRDLARSHGFNVLVANQGADALRLARDYRPSAISLDVFLPDMLGWAVLARLKHDIETRHIPVQILTVDGRATAASNAVPSAFLPNLPRLSPSARCSNAFAPTPCNGPSACW